MYSAVFFAIIGTVLYGLEEHQNDFSNFTPVFAFDIKTFWGNLMAFNGTGVISLGIIFLFLIPISRVVFYLVKFIQEGNRLYIVICSIILSVIITGFFLK